jgi:hypothetical protein
MALFGSLPISFNNTLTPWMTAGDIVNRAALRLGLVTVTDPFSATDQNQILLCSLLDEVGRDLWTERVWTQLTQFYSFVSVQDQAAYPLPAGFGFLINQTGWNRTNRLPLLGPLSPQEWEYLKAILVNVVFTVLFRPLQQQLFLFPDTNTPGGYTIAFEYISRYWVQSSTATAPDKDTPTESADIIWFDPQLMIRALKLAFLKQKGFDTSAAQADYDRTLQLIMATDSAAPILNLAGQPYNDFPLIGQQNVPLIGFGIS